MYYKCIPRKSEDDIGDMDDISCICSPCVINVSDGTPKPTFCPYDQTYQNWEIVKEDTKTIDTIYAVSVEMFGERATILLCRDLKTALEYQKANPVLKPEIIEEVLYLTYKAITDREGSISVVKFKQMEE